MKSEYAQIMRDIDNYKMLVREANEQRMRIEEEIGEVQTKIHNIEIDSKRNKEELYRRLLETPTAPQPSSFQKPPNPNHLNSEKSLKDRTRIEQSNISRQSAQQMIKDSMRTLPGFTELVKNSEMYEAFRVSYAKDLQEYYKFNTSNLNRDINQSNNKSEVISSHSGSKADHKRRDSGLKNKDNYNYTIKETPYENEDDRSSVYSETMHRDEYLSTPLNDQIIAQSEISYSNDQNGGILNVPSDAHMHRARPTRDSIPTDDVRGHPSRWEKRRMSANRGNSDQNVKMSDSDSIPKAYNQIRDKELILPRDGKIAGDTDLMEKQVYGILQSPEKGKSDQSAIDGFKQRNIPKRTPEEGTKKDISLNEGNKVISKTMTIKEDDFATVFGNNISDSEGLSELRVTPNKPFLERPTSKTTTEKGSGTKREETLTFRPKDTPNKHSPNRDFYEDSNRNPIQSDLGYEEESKRNMTTATDKNEMIEDEYIVDEFEEIHDTESKNTPNQFGVISNQTNTCTFRQNQSIDEEDDQIDIREDFIEESHKSISRSDEENNKDFIHEQYYGTDNKIRNKTSGTIQTHASKKQNEAESLLDYSNTRKMTNTEEAFGSNLKQAYNTSKNNNNNTGGSNSRNFRISVGSKDRFRNRESRDEGASINTNMNDNSKRSPADETSIIRNFNNNVRGLNNFENPASTNIFDRERYTPHNNNNEIEKNFGFDTSDISLLKKDSKNSDSAGNNMNKKNSNTVKEKGKAGERDEEEDFFSVRNKEMINRFDEFFNKMKIQDDIIQEEKDASRAKSRGENNRDNTLPNADNSKLNRDTFFISADDESHQIFYKESKIDYNEYVNKIRQKNNIRDTNMKNEKITLQASEQEEYEEYEDIDSAFYPEDEIDVKAYENVSVSEEEVSLSMATKYPQQKIIKDTVFNTTNNDKLVNKNIKNRYNE